MATLRSVTADFQLHVRTSLHVGTGRAAGLVNRTLRRNADGAVYVPGAALKGALRETTDRLVGRLDRELRDYGFGETELLGLRRRAGATLTERCLAPKPDQMCQGERACIVCRLFGNVFTGTRLRVDDASPVTDPAEQKTYKKVKKRRPDLLGKVAGREWDRETLTQLQIDRRRRGAKEGALFTSAYAPPGLRFTSRLSGRVATESAALDPEAPPVELILLGATLRALDQVGANASTGHGLCQIDVDALRVDGTAMSVDDLVGHLGEPLVMRLMNKHYG